MGIVSAVVNILLAFILPLGVAAYLWFRRPRSALWMLTGAAAYAVFHLLARAALLPLLTAQPWYILLTRAKPIARALLLGLFAALTEAGGRRLSIGGIRRLTRQNLSLFEGTAFGAGYGGVEAVLSGTDTVVSLFLLGGETDALPAIFRGMGGAGFFLAQIALSVLITYGLLRRRFLYFPAVVLLHAAFAASGELLASGLIRGWMSGLASLLLATGMIAWCYVLYQRHPEPDVLKEDEKSSEKPDSEKLD